MRPRARQVVLVHPLHNWSLSLAEADYFLPFGGACHPKCASERASSSSWDPPSSEEKFFAAGLSPQIPPRYSEVVCRCWQHPRALFAPTLSSLLITFAL